LFLGFLPHKSITERSSGKRGDAVRVLVRHRFLADERPIYVFEEIHFHNEHQIFRQGMISDDYYRIVYVGYYHLLLYCIDRDLRV